MLKSRIEKLEAAQGGAAALPVVLFVNPQGDAAHAAEVRRVGRMPNGFLVCYRDVNGPDPLAELLGPDDPLTRQQAVCIERSYG